MPKQKSNWKRRVKRLSLFLCVATTLLVYVTFNRFHFSTQTPWPLSQLQWNYQPNFSFEGVPPQVIGHRGSGIRSLNGDLIIGNTYNAIDQGITAGVDWVEIDVRVSGGPNPELVVFHDETIDAKTTGEGEVSDLNLAELKDVFVNLKKPERILTLDEVFAEFHGKHERWILDVKAEKIHHQVLEWLDHKIKNKQLSIDQVIIFGTYDVLKDYKESVYSLGYTAIWGKFWNRPRVLFNPSQIINRCQCLECEYLVLPVIFASGSLINSAKMAGVDVWVYGIEDRRDFDYLAQRGVSGFIVDFPENIIGQSNEDAD